MPLAIFRASEAECFGNASLGHPQETGFGIKKPDYMITYCIGPLVVYNISSDTTPVGGRGVFGAVPKETSPRL